MGWPRDLPSAASEEFDERVTGWLLDRGPSDLRSSDLRGMPVALAYVIETVVEAQIAGLRRAYATSRSELGTALSATQLVRAQAAIEAEGARLLQVRREVALVGEALRLRTPSS